MNADIPRTKAIDTAPTVRRIALPALLALGAMGVAIYLAVVALQDGARPLGCGNEGGCNAVLSSHWSRWGPVPVAILGAVLYAAVLTVLLLLPRCRRTIDLRRAWRLLVVLVAVMLGGALWMTVLQLAVIGSLCLWCMADHAMGIVLAAVVLIMVPWGRDRASGPGRGTALTGVLAALVSVSVLFAGQYLAGVEAARRDSWTATAGGDVGPTEIDPYAVPLSVEAQSPAAGGLPIDPSIGMTHGTEPPVRKRRVVLSEGRIKVTLPLPMLGSADAEHVIVELFDYACNHCRHMYHLLEGVREQFGETLAVVTLPVPLNPACNKNVKEHKRGFADACTLAELALAVWLADKDSFEAMHAWLFESKDVPKARDAKAYAEELVGAEALADALENAWIESQIPLDVRLHERTSGLDNSGATLPKIIHRYGVVTGLPTNTDALARLLQRTLGLRPANPVKYDGGL